MKLLALPLDETDTRWIDAWVKALPGDELAHADRFHRPVDRTRYIAAHALLRCALSALDSRAPASLPLARGMHGKPFLSDGPKPQFNLTHTEGLAAIALHDRPVGCDAEPIGRRVTEAAFAMMAVEERAWLRTFDTEDARGRAFIRLWTVKEAFAKAAGPGLSLPLHSFAFDLTARCPYLLRAPPEYADGIDWTFGHHDAGPRHIIALAAQGAAIPVEVRFCAGADIARAATTGPPLLL